VAKTLLTSRVRKPRAEMESNIVSSDKTTESQDTDSSDELTELVAVASSPSVSGSPGVRMGVRADAVPVPEVEPEAHEVNTINFKKASRHAGRLFETARLRQTKSSFYSLFGSCP